MESECELPKGYYEAKPWHSSPGNFKSWNDSGKESDLQAMIGKLAPPKHKKKKRR